MIKYFDLIPTDCRNLIFIDIIHTDPDMYLTSICVCKEWMCLLQDNTELKQKVQNFYEQKRKEIVPCMTYVACKVYKTYIGKFQSPQQKISRIEKFIQDYNVEQTISVKLQIHLPQIEKIIVMVLDHYGIKKFDQIGVVNVNLIKWCQDSKGIFRSELEREFENIFPNAKQIAMKSLTENFSEIIKEKYPYS